MQNKKTYYDILKIQPGSNDEDVRKAYMQLAHIYHPDKNPGKKHMAALKFKMINEAYTALKTQGARERYSNILLNENMTKLKAHNDNAAPPHATMWHKIINLLAPARPSQHKISER